MRTFLLLLLAITGHAAEVKLVYPTNWTVVQRTDSEEATLPLAIRVNSAVTETVNVEVVFEEKNTLATITFNYAISHVPSAIKESQFITNVTVPTGWYRVTLAQAAVEDSIANFGVGDVFLVAGQSNSTNNCNVRFSTDEERVTCYSPASKLWKHADDPMFFATELNGSAWPDFGGRMVAAHGVPVGIVSVGVSSTAVAEWIPGTTNYTTRIVATRDAMKFPIPNNTVYSIAGPYLKALLWHQGERDNALGTSQANYYSRLSSIITQSRTTFANADLPWFVANATWNNLSPTTSTAVRAAQQQTWLLPDVYAGPDTDALDGSYRWDNIHFNQIGNREHSRLWAESVLAIFP